MKLIDTHIHIWDLENIRYEWLEGNESILNQTYHLEDLELRREEAGVSGGVLVQAENHFQDTDWMLLNAEKNDWILGVVGWVPLLDPEGTEKALGNYLKNPYFKGVRHLIHDENDPQWLLQPEVLESLKILAHHRIPYDVVGVLTEHIETAMVVANKVPSLNMVFDHMNQPPIANGERFGKWGDLMKEASSHGCFHQKISGLGTTTHKGTNWSEDDIKPYLEFIFDQFGVDCCFVGGDWPVSLLAGEYVDTISNYRKAIANLLTAGEQEKVFHLNATQFYNLEA